MNWDMPNLPVPYFKVNRSLDIISRSALANTTFVDAVNLLDIADEGSFIKLMEFIRPDKSQVKLEVTLKTRLSPLQLYDLVQKWDTSGYGHVVCIEKSNQMNEVQNAIRNLQESFEAASSQGMSPSRRWSVHSLPQKRKEQREYTLTAVADSGTEPVLRDVLSQLGTVKDMMKLLRPSLLEIGKDQYADIILEQTEQSLYQIRDLLARQKRDEL
ncbi:hypothetical protein [Paenibacillus gansuensis]|uniref:Uncharacterized protein n=1 Tax=Paenibacillus gansuensis TaxID=306542 RepID=A0ABW5PE59_9BACL